MADEHESVSVEAKTERSETEIRELEDNNQNDESGETDAIHDTANTQAVDQENLLTDEGTHEDVKDSEAKSTLNEDLPANSTEENTDKNVDNSGTVDETLDEGQGTPLNNPENQQTVPENETVEHDMEEEITLAIETVPEEEGTGPDITIATQELEEDDIQYDQGADTFGNQEFPDAYSTPPPAALETNEFDAFNDIPEEEEEDSEREFSPEYPVFDRGQLLERYKEVFEERSQLQNLNNQLQHKLAEYFRKKKTDERVQEIEKNVTDQEQRYLKYISNLQELQNEERRQQEEIKAQKEEMKQRCLEKQDKVEDASDEFVKFKYEVAKAAINSRSGKSIPQKDLEIFQAMELKKEQEVRQVRLENIKLKNKLRKKEHQLKAKEELAEGLHLIDFEQLKIENQTYNEKIEERNEEILKLRKKITTTVQVLTHLKEKLQFVQGENCEQRNKLKTIEATVAQKRDVLTRTKQVRDALRMDNLKLKQKCGLLGNESLLRDFEHRKDEGEDLGQKLKDLRNDHTGLSMNLNGVKKKLRQSRVQSA